MNETTDPAVPAKPAARRPAARKQVAAKPVKSKPPAKPAPKRSAPPSDAVANPSKAKTVEAPAPAPVAKGKKPKLVRDSFTMPKDEYQHIDALKLRAARLGRPVKKSELIRAGLAWLFASDDASLMAALAAVPTLKAGRPKAAG